MYTSIICWSYISLSLCFISWTWVKYFHSELYSTALTNHCNRPQPILYICREYSKMEIKFRFFTQWYWYQVFNFKEFLGYYKSMFFSLGRSWPNQIFRTKSKYLAMKRHQNTQNCRKSEIYICKTCEGLRAVCTNCNDSFNIFSYS